MAGRVSLPKQVFLEEHDRQIELIVVVSSLAETVTLIRRHDVPHSPAWLRMTVEYLHAHALENIRLDDVATAAGVHSAHLSRVFRKHYRCSVGQYVRSLRIDLAARELAASHRPIAEIAADFGFADQSHFSRVFAKLTGLTPGRYRKLTVR